MPRPPQAVVQADLPHGKTFMVTTDALEMIEIFGGALHCHLGPGGCRSQGLYFSPTVPRKPVFSRLSFLHEYPAFRHPDLTAVHISVSSDLAPKISGALLDFGEYNGVQRFIWLTMPAARGPRCTCRRSTGSPAGKRSPCLDDQRVGLTGR